MNKMSYQDAARTRKKSFISMITEKLVEGNSIGSSIKATISEKSAARAKGFKEKIDPMNIIKFMTGGSKFAAALYGSARGRSKEDMKYFTGAPRSAKEMGASSTRIDSLETGNEMVSLLMKIYEFMRNTNEEDKTRKQREANFKEEMEYERGLRHKALLEALSGLKPGKTVTATKETDDGGFGGIFAGLISFVKGLIDDALKGVMAILNGITELIEKSLIKMLGQKLIWSMIIRSVPQLAMLWGIYESKEYLDKILYAERMKDKEGKSAQKAFKEKQTDFSKLKLTQDEAKAILEQDPGIGKDRDIASFGGIERVQAIADGKPDPGGIIPESNEEIKRKLKLNEEIRKQKSTSVPTSQAEAQDLKNVAGQQPMPVPAVPASNVLNEKTKEMNDANLPKPVMAPKSETFNTTNVMADKKIAPTGPLPSVRNQEPTFANMILYSTRVV
jgi:hypothetical protein